MTYFFKVTSWNSPITLLATHEWMPNTATHTKLRSAMQLGMAYAKFSDLDPFGKVNQLIKSFATILTNEELQIFM